ncbi:MAG: 16S rRNA (cytosine(1402)-N(4))-methyltransferase RsmH [Bacillota bacterium]|nr:16S rRNA (cytosine(1402)-N(4))-methyltransferase RsmH [Bacillota bacterium]
MERKGHQPVLRDEAVWLLKCRPGGWYLDCTFGGGGHAALILDLIGPAGRLIALDRDPEAIRLGKELFRDAVAQGRLILRQADFRELRRVWVELGQPPLEGILFDLGVSSFQLEDPGRGFSYQQEGPLDMRMDPRQGVTAAELVNTLPPRELAKLIRRYGEERWAGRIARFIAEARARRRIETTGQLVEVIKDAIPAAARRRGPHPAKRTFQALRIAVNQELQALGSGLIEALEVAAPGGRVAVLSFHSLEDRLVKEVFRAASAGQTYQGRVLPPVRLVTARPLEPRPEEVAANPRARSARLRVAERRRSTQVPS